MLTSKVIKINKFLYLCLIICIIFYIVSILRLKNLPQVREMHPDLFNNPIQSSGTLKESFIFNYRGTDYNVKPMADYELWGLVVSHNDIGRWYNMYHDKNSVNIKDICVIWGENISSGIYQKMKFKNGEFTCYVGWGELSWQEARKFRNDNLSNNHLIASEESIREIIRDVRVGDQIHLKGVLSSYGKVDTSEQYYRSSSLRRDDVGDGACETVFVDEIEILKRSMVLWYKIKDFSLYCFLFFIVLKCGLFLYEAFL